MIKLWIDCVNALACCCVIVSSNCENQFVDQTLSLLVQLKLNLINHLERLTVVHKSDQWFVCYQWFPKWLSLHH